MQSTVKALKSAWSTYKTLKRAGQSFDLAIAAVTIVYGSDTPLLSQERTSQAVRERLQTGTRMCGTVGVVDKGKTSLHVLDVASFPGLLRLQLLIAYWKQSKTGGVEGLGTRLY